VGKQDFLIIDLPPGTGDAQLTLTQKVALSGAVIVTTPQDVALYRRGKGLAMFQKVNVPDHTASSENMSGFECPKCGHVEADLQDRRRGETALQLGVPFLGRIPLDPRIALSGDAGMPIVARDPDSLRRSPSSISDGAVAKAVGA